MKRYVLLTLAVALISACSNNPSGGLTPGAPVNLADLNLNGRLLYTQGPLGLIALDMASGQEETLYRPPPDGLVTGAASNGEQIILVYAPPPPQGEIQFGYSDLYIMPADGSEDPILYLEGGEETFLSTPLWSGDYLYYVVFQPGLTESGYRLMRQPSTDASPETVLDDAYQPSISADGERIAYIRADASVDPPVDELYIANADGSEPRLLVGRDSFDAVDMPRFTPDGGSLLFSAVNEDVLTTRDWADWLFGVEVAFAHDVPSDIWQVDLNDGDVTRLTAFGAVGIRPSFSPDGEHLALATTSGLYIMPADGTRLNFVVPLSGATTMEWVP